MVSLVGRQQDGGDIHKAEIRYDARRRSRDLQRIGAERSLAQRLPATTSRPKNEPAIPFASNSRMADSWAPARMRSSTFRSIDTGGS